MVKELIPKKPIVSLLLTVAKPHKLFIHYTFMLMDSPACVYKASEKSPSMKLWTKRNIVMMRNFSLQRSPSFPYF